MRTDPATGRQHVLACGAHRAVVTEVGATLRCWEADGVEVVDGFAAEVPGHGYRGKVLMPWPNRLRDGAYDFDGDHHQTALTEPERGNALHGLACWVGWRAVRRRPATVTLAQRLHPQPGYPFMLDLEVTYRLVPEGLEVILHAVNAGATAAPFGAGWHPYFATGGAPVDELRLVLPAGAWLPVDDRLLPDGPPSPVDGTGLDFRRPRAVGGVALDTCFARLARDADGLARVRADRPDGCRLELWMDERFDYVQAFTADADPDPARRRRCLALEPMSCAPDAFNSTDGLIVLSPGEAFTGRCGVTVTRR